jgi:hypothetical protein
MCGRVHWPSTRAQRMRVAISSSCATAHTNPPSTHTPNARPATRILWSFKLNPYERLNLRFTATPEEVRRQFRKLSLMVHPDKCGHPQAAEAFDSEWAVCACAGGWRARQRRPRDGVRAHNPPRGGGGGGAASAAAVANAPLCPRPHPSLTRVVARPLSRPLPPPRPLAVLGAAQKELLDEERRAEVWQVLDAARGEARLPAWCAACCGGRQRLHARATSAPPPLRCSAHTDATQLHGHLAPPHARTVRPSRPTTHRPTRPQPEELRKEREKETKHDTTIELAALLHEVRGVAVLCALCVLLQCARAAAAAAVAGACLSGRPCTRAPSHTLAR